MHRDPNVGFDPGSPGSCPGPKAGAKPLRHPGIPLIFLFIQQASLQLHLGVSPYLQVPQQSPAVASQEPSAPLWEQTPRCLIPQSPSPTTFHLSDLVQVT